jgi:hypothetical protein
MEEIIDELALNGEQTDVLSEKAIATLTSTAPWVKFSAIMGYVVSAGGLVLNISTGSIYRSMGYNFSTGTSPNMIFAVIICGIGILTSTYLLLYALKLVEFGKSHNPQDLYEAFKNQRIYYTITGILCIIYLCVITLGLIGGGIAALMMSHG